MKYVYFRVTFWLGLTLRAKSVEIGQNPQDKKWWVKIVSVESKKDGSDDMFIARPDEIQSIEFIKE
jgi:hypothetical protein